MGRMKITAAHHVAICTPNFAKLCDFYINTLGLKLVGKFEERNILFVEAGSTTIEIAPSSTVNARMKKAKTPVITLPGTDAHSRIHCTTRSRER